MTTINKLKNAWLSNDTSLSGPNQTVSLLNEGKSEFKDNCIIDTKLSINKGIDGTNDYKLDVNGNTYVNGNISYSGALNGIKSTSLNIRSLLIANNYQYTLTSPYYYIYFFDNVGFTSNTIINFPFSLTIPNGMTFCFLMSQKSSTYDITFQTFDSSDKILPFQTQYGSAVSSFTIDRTITYIQFVKVSSGWWSVLSSGASLLNSLNTWTGVNNFGTITGNTVASTDNSTNLSTTSFVKGQNYTTLLEVENNDNIFTGYNIFFAPSFCSNSQSTGGIICGFNSQNGDSRFVMYDEGT